MTDARSLIDGPSDETVERMRISRSQTRPMSDAHTEGPGESEPPHREGSWLCPWDCEGPGDPRHQRAPEMSDAHEVPPCPGPASWGNAYDGSLSRWRVKCDCGFLVENLTSAEAAEDTYRWHRGLPSSIGANGADR